MDTAEKIVEELEEKEKKLGRKFAKFYNENYKKLLIIPAIILILSLGYIIYFYSVTGDFIKRDVSLSGGTTIILFPENEINLQELNNYLSNNLDDFSIRELSNFRSGKQEAIVVESPLNSSQVKKILEDFLKYGLTEDNSNIEFTGSTLSLSFYKQLRLAVIISFILMAIVVFVIFRTITPSAAVVISAFADIAMTLALVNFLGMTISGAGVIAFLMLIGYSVDTDIMLTTRLLKRGESDNKGLSKAFKTGITMTLTSIVAIGAALIITQSFSEILRQILTILLIGLGFDILNTWITNASILKWHLESKRK